MLSLARWRACDWQRRRLFARKCDALLIGVGAEGIDPAIFAYQGGDAGVLGLLREQTQADLKAAADSFGNLAGAVRKQWIALEERPAACLSVAGGGRDRRRG